MKIAIMSDTHDNSPAVVEIIEYLNEHKITTAFHAGDIVNPGIVRRFAQHYTGTLHFVFGNNDGEKSGITNLASNNDNLACYNREMELELDGKKIFMNHYTYVAKAKAAEGGFDLCIGGHTHKHEVETIGKTLFINPGHGVTKDKWLSDWDDRESSIVILETDDMSYERVILNS